MLPVYDFVACGHLVRWLDLIRMDTTVLAALVEYSSEICRYTLSFFCKVKGVNIELVI